MNPAEWLPTSSNHLSQSPFPVLLDLALIQLTIAWHPLKGTACVPGGHSQSSPDGSFCWDDVQWKQALGTDAKRFFWARDPWETIFLLTSEILIVVKLSLSITDRQAAVTSPCLYPTVICDVPNHWHCVLDLKKQSLSFNMSWISPVREGSGT